MHPVLPNIFVANDLFRLFFDLQAAIKRFVAHQRHPQALRLDADPDKIVAADRAGVDP